jgi:hypothetical protein
MKHMCRAHIVWGRTETHVNVAERDFLLYVSSPPTQSSDACSKIYQPFFVNKHLEHGISQAYKSKSGAS